MKISFITCVNDENEYDECLYYIERLNIPDGDEIICLPIKEAPSMASGYNLASNSEPADISVYLHQDTCIIDPDYIQNIKSIFNISSSIGVIGCTGNSDIQTRRFMNYDLGKVFHHGAPLLLDLQKERKDYYPAGMVDGFIFATRYNIPFREDIFDGWDFYDVSCCMEYKRAGYDVVVAGQDSPWCYHANTFSNMTHYYTYEERFMKEYFPEKDYCFTDIKRDSLEYSRLQVNTLNIIKELVNTENRQELYTLFKANEYRGQGFLKELEAIADIDYLERGTGVSELLWPDGTGYDFAVKNLRNLRHLMKRLEYKAFDDETDLLDQIHKYSDYAIFEINEKYIYSKF